MTTVYPKSSAEFLQRWTAGAKHGSTKIDVSAVSDTDVQRLNILADIVNHYIDTAPDETTQNLKRRMMGHALQLQLFYLNTRVQGQAASVEQAGSLDNEKWIAVPPLTDATIGDDILGLIAWLGTDDQTQAIVASFTQWFNASPLPSGP